MSIAMLRNAIQWLERSKKVDGNTYNPTAHLSCHDLESLIWAAEYALFRMAHNRLSHWQRTDAVREAFEEAFIDEFGHTTAKAIQKQRQQTALNGGRFASIQDQLSLRPGAPGIDSRTLGLG